MRDYYFFNSTDTGTCTETCMVKNDGTMIGSVTCQQCENCIDKDRSIWGCDWIICSKINDATSTRDERSVATTEAQSENDG